MNRHKYLLKSGLHEHGRLDSQRSRDLFRAGFKELKLNAVAFKETAYIINEFISKTVQVKHISAVSEHSKRALFSCELNAAKRISDKSNRKTPPFYKTI